MRPFNCSFNPKQLWERNKTRVITIGVALTLLFIALLFGVEQLAKSKIRAKCEAFKQERGVTIQFDEFSMKGFNEFRFKGLSIVPHLGDTLFSVKRLHVRLRLLPLLILRPNIESIEMEGTIARFIKKEGYCNYDFLFPSTPQDTTKLKEKEPLNFAKLTHRLFDLFFRATPESLHMTHTEVSSINKGYLTEMLIQNLILQDHKLNATLQIADSAHLQTWIAEGEFDKKQKTIQGVLRGQTDQDTLRIPYFDKVYQAKIQFQALRFALKVNQSKTKEVKFDGQFATQGLCINYWRLSPNDIVPGNLAINCHCTALPQSIEIDSTSTVQFNQITIHPYLQIRKNKDWGIRCSLNEKEIPAQTLLTSLPKGLFSTLNQTTFAGNFDYHFLFDLDLDQPDSLIFEAGVPNHSIQILNLGRLAKLNAPFLHTAYRNERPVRTFIIGETNPNYRPLTAISPLLQHSVLQSEDGQFYYHAGFQPDALREALVHDIKVRRFARGGSSISMQLVKNVFLSSNKNIFRKVEEAAIVWLIENKRITSKARQFEVYLNLIEWGPMIYGAEEAARYYFDKTAAQLDLQEALFLSSIIPNPALYRYAFDPATLKIKENRTNHFRRVAYRLAKAGLITEEEAQTIIPNVTLKGAAKASFAQPDTSLLPEEVIPIELE